MDLRRLQQLAGLTETITNDSQLNSRIEAALDTVAPDDRPAILDALEILYSGAEPITARTWADQVKALHPESDPAVILTQTRRLFPWLAARTADNQYQWHVVNELDPAYRAMHSQITLTDTAKHIMKTLGTFTLQQLTDQISSELNVPPHSIVGWVMHLLQSLPGKITQQGNTYTYHTAPAPTRSANMDLLRRLAGNPGNSRDED